MHFVMKKSRISSLNAKVLLTDLNFILNEFSSSNNSICDMPFFIYIYIRTLFRHLKLPALR